MQSQKRVLSSVVLVAVAFVMVIGLTVFMTGQEAPGQQPTGWVDDWTHHRLVFSNPGTEQDAINNRTYGQWYTITHDPRYQLQQLKRSHPQQAVAPAVSAAPADFATRWAAAMASRPIPVVPKPKRNPIKKDWSVDLNGPSSVGTISSNNGSGSPLSSVTINSTTLNASPPTPEQATLTVSSLPTSTAATVTVTNGTNNFVLTENGAAASATGNFYTPPTAAALGTIGIGPNTLNLQTTATAASFPLTLDTTGTTNSGSITYTYTGWPSSVTIKISPASSGGGTSCPLTSGTYTGTFNESSTNTTAAGNFLTELNTCLGSSYANIASSFTTGRSSATVTLTDLYRGSFLTVSNSLNRTSGTITNGTAGSGPSCTAAGNTYTVDYVVSNSPSSMASSLQSALNGCAAAAYVSTGTLSGTALPISATVLGTGTFTPSDTAVFNFTGVNGGSKGSYACANSTSGTFGTDTTTALVATSISNAINACSPAIQAATGINASSSTGGGSGVTIYAYTPGTTGGSGISLPTPGGGFASWGGTSLSGGTNGTTNTTTWGYWATGSYLTTAQVAANIATTINTNSTLDTQVTAVANGSTVTVTALTEGVAYVVSAANFNLTWSPSSLTGGAQSTVQPNTYPAKYGASLTNASCSQDFVIYPTGMTGSTSAANIVAYNNLYSSCSTNGPVPSEIWAYNTGGAVTTSPVFSWDGRQVAFIQVSGTTASLVLLKWAANTGTLTAPVSPATATSSTYQGCTAPCTYTMTLSGSPNDTFSSPFYAYNTDTIYVGDDVGKLHQFTGVFGGTPAENTTSPWPVTLTSGNKVSSPVYDINFGYVEVGDFGGFFYFVTASSGAVQKDGSYGDVIADAPLVDGAHGETLAFVTTGGTSFGNGTNSVVEFDTLYGVPSAASGFVSVGTGAAGYYLYAGSYDNVYYVTTTRNVTGAGGNLYVLGNTGATTGAALYQVTMTGNQYNTQSWISGVSPVVGSLTPSGAHPWPSPLTEFCSGPCGLNSGQTQTASGSTDYIFFSLNRASVGSCTNTAGNGCVLSYNVSNPSSVAISGTGLKVTTPGTNGCWATGGLVIDNSDTTTTGASQIYFLNLNGIAAGGPVVGTKTSSNCTAGASTAIINATQASQSNP